MGWRDCLEDEGAHLVTPWLGGRRIYRERRVWRVRGELPREYGWYEWRTVGRIAELVGPHEADFDYTSSIAPHTVSCGYLVGDRMVMESLGWGRSPDALLEYTVPIFLVETGLDRFARVEVGHMDSARLFYRQELFPRGPEDDIRQAFVDRRDSIDHVAGVIPALDIAFRFATRQRATVEARRAVLERLREEERRREELVQSTGSSVGRRILAATDFETAARSALAVSGAKLLDTRQGRRNNEKIVQYLLQNRRFECVVEGDTLRIISSGICLTDSSTGEKGDDYFTLESLPAVVCQAIQEDELHVYRHVD